jgi:cyclic beta-1,2-glucan synthetase
LEVDLVILNEDFSGYRQVLAGSHLGLIASGTEAHRMDKPGGIFVRRSEDLTEEDRVLLQTVARVILTDGAETLAQQVERPAPGRERSRVSQPTRIAHDRPARSPPPPRDLVFFNGLGGFTKDGREYVIARAGPGHARPVGECPRQSRGSARSSPRAAGLHLGRQRPRVPPHPVAQRPGQRSERRGLLHPRRGDRPVLVADPAARARGRDTYVCRHGFGYSVFEYAHHGISTELWTYVATDAPVKFVVVKVRNRSGRPRRLSVTGYWEWVLGQWRHTNLMHIVTDPDPATGALFAATSTTASSPERPPSSASTTRAIRHRQPRRVSRAQRHPARPPRWHRQPCRARPGAGLDPCAALQVPFDLADGTGARVRFPAGGGQRPGGGPPTGPRFGGSGRSEVRPRRRLGFWKRTLGTVHAETPDPALNFLVNGWLEYQTLACRYWGRSGYYQSGGAYGFRDQLQDTTALLHAAPWTTASTSCARQPQFRRGRCAALVASADRPRRAHPFLRRLPLAALRACRYVGATGDTGVLDEAGPFLEGRPVNADEESYYDLPQRSNQEGTLYDHCVRAIRRTPLRRARAAADRLRRLERRHESCRVRRARARASGWPFSSVTSSAFRGTGEGRRRHLRRQMLPARRCKLRLNIEASGWDGDWYRRAYFDDGTPLGSASNEECQIDSIAQSWAVLSGAGDPDRARLAMEKRRPPPCAARGGLIQAL